MRLQSAIEFLSTYSFMFLIVSLVLVIVFYFAFPTQTVIQSQCTIFGSVQCSYIIFHTNTIANNANVIFQLFNSGSAPINVITANVVIGGNTFVGGCTPTLLSPGAAAVCNTIVTPSEPIGTQVHGYLSLSVNYCNSDVSQFGNVVSQVNCTYSPLKYEGEFFSYASHISATSTSTSTSSIP